jgi:integrase
VCLELNLPQITPHGFRSYFATKLHRDGKRDEDIAAAIGDRTVSLVQNTYRECPGGEKLGWLPSNGIPGWRRW